MLFTQLSEKSKLKAINEYKYGWEKTHTKDDLSIEEIRETLEDNTEYEYYIDGSLKPTLEEDYSNIMDGISYNELIETIVSNVGTRADEYKMRDEFEKLMSIKVRDARTIFNSMVTKLQHRMKEYQ